MAVNKAAASALTLRSTEFPAARPLCAANSSAISTGLIRGVPTPPKSRLHPMAFLEDAESIQASLMETINALVRNTIDFRRAQLILRALHIAAKNAPRAHFNFSRPSMVDEVPQYPAAPEPKPIEAALEQAGVLIYAGRPSLPKWATMAARSISASADLARPNRPRK